MPTATNALNPETGPFTICPVGNLSAKRGAPRGPWTTSANPSPITAVSFLTAAARRASQPAPGPGFPAAPFGRGGMDEDELLLEEEDRIGFSGDEDAFGVELEEGVAYEVAVVGESVLDAVVEVYDEDGELLFEDDDSLFGLDPYLQFVAPEDGDYEVVVRDAADAVGDYVLLMGESDAPLIA